MNKYFRLTLFLLAINLKIIAQPIIPRFETLSVNEGLSQSSVYAIIQDKYGFMWFGTADGLNRYDGNEIKVYKIQNDRIDVEPNYIRGNLCTDSDANIYFSNEAGIYIYEQRRDTIYSLLKFDKKEFASASFEGIFIQKNVMWMMSNWGIYSVDLGSKELKKYSHPIFKINKAHLPNKLSTDQNGNIWFGFFEQDGLYKFDIHTHQFTHFFEHQDYNSIHFGKGRHFIISKNKVLLYDSSTRQSSILFSKNLSSDATIVRVFEDNYQRIWAYSNTDGVVYFEELAKVAHNLLRDNKDQNSLPINIVSSHYIDANDNLWFGTDGAGVASIDLKPRKFQLFPHNEKDYPFLNDFFTKCFFEDASGNVWVGMHNNGICILNPKTNEVKIIKYFQKKLINVVGSIFEDKDKNIWVGYAKGFLILDRKTNHFTTIKIPKEIPLAENAIYVNDIKQLPNGDIVSATQWGLVLIKKENEQYHAYTYYGKADFGSLATSIALGDNNSFWLSSPNAGLLHCQYQDSLFISEKIFVGVNIRSIHVDETNKSIIWLSTSRGLIKYNHKTHEQRIFTEKDGMANSYIYGVLEDEQHNFWMSCNAGLLYFDRKKNTFQNFNANDGLQSNEFNSGAFYKGASGTFYFGGIKGFNWFQNIFEQSNKTFKPKLAITSIWVDDKPISSGTHRSAQQAIQLPFNKNKVSFNLAVLDFTRTKANKIYYKLEPWDKEWVITQSKNIFYKNLPSGKYTLRIKAANGDGVCSNEALVQLNIKAPFWKCWWFYSTFILFIVAIAVLITKIISQRALNKKLQMLENEKAIEDERNRISKDMHDEIGSGLTHIALMAEMMLSKKQGHENLQKEVGSISASARKLVNSMSEIVWALNLHYDTLDNLLAYLREQTVAYFEPFDMDYSIHFPQEIPDIKLSNEQRRNLFLICKETLHNALKHAQATVISLSVSIQEGSIHFSIQDNGKGFDIARVGRSANGLRNMQKRMNSIGGSLNIVTSSLGTNIHFSLPIPK